jgi:hypothetical protein
LTGNQDNESGTITWTMKRKEKFWEKLNGNNKFSLKIITKEKEEGKDKIVRRSGKR